MTNKKKWLGILVLVLVFGMTVVGCDNDSISDNDSINGSSGYTFEFKIRYSYTPIFSQGKLIKIEFINGSTSNAEVLATETVNLVGGDMTSVYRVSGFTNKEGGGCIFGVKATYENENNHFKWGVTTKNGDKILVDVDNLNYGSIIHFSDGNW